VRRKILIVFLVALVAICSLPGVAAEKKLTVISVLVRTGDGCVHAGP